MKPNIFHILLALVVLASCQTPQETENTPDSHRDTATTPVNPPSGKLFIIGGGKRPPSLIERLAQEAGVDSTQGYALILPMASGEPDSATWYAARQFKALGVATAGFPWKKGHMGRTSLLDSLQNAPLIYMTGGDQNRFMEIIAGTQVKALIHKAYHNGSTIAGTSAGAAVMSARMITGNEKHYPEYNATFRNLEADNIEFGEGLGLVSMAIIDQHFVKRSRYNRLLSAAMEYPSYLGVGIDESTAALVTQGINVEVVGQSQIILFRGPKEGTHTHGALLGTKGLVIDVLLPGETFTLPIDPKP